MSHIRVYRADLSQLCAEACLSLLSDEEKRRVSRLSDRAARHEFVTSRALLRLLLSKHTGEPASALQFATGPCGKPALLGSQGVHFNLSHSHGMALVAIASAEIGIDVERIDATVDYDGVAETMFSPCEIGMLRSAAALLRGNAFFSIWTRKEAYLKATGLGFSSNLPKISTVSAAGVVEDKGTTFDSQDWHAFDLSAPAGFKAAIVTTCRDSFIDVLDVAGLRNLAILKRTSDRHHTMPVAALG